MTCFHILLSAVLVAITRCSALHLPNRMSTTGPLLHDMSVPPSSTDLSESTVSPSMIPSSTITIWDPTPVPLYPAFGICGYYAAVPLECGPERMFPCTNSGSWRGCYGQTADDGTGMDWSIPTACYSNGAPECSSGTALDQITCCSEAPLTNCGTFLYSTTTSETFTMLRCVDKSFPPGPLILCVHDDCGPFTTTVLSTVEATDSDTVPGTTTSTIASTVETTQSKTTTVQDSTAKVSTIQITNSGIMTPTNLPESTSPSIAAPTPAISSSTPVAAIVGATLGGLFLALALFLGWYYCIQRKHKTTERSQDIHLRHLRH